MKSKLGIIALLLASTLCAAQYRDALPGYKYEFPRDYFSHPEFQTEWWYYTGNLQSADGHRFGFELTFFRQGLSRPAGKDDSPWVANDLYFAHFAISDIGGGQFYREERSNRAGPGIAGADPTQGLVWNGNWQVQISAPHQEMQALSEQVTLHLSLESEKPPVIHGENGVSQKADGPGRASHYISLTRLRTSGSILVEGKTYNVTGLSWMDHEFFTHQLTEQQSGWDWLSLQLSDGTELMLFRLRRKDGTADHWSAGTYVDRDGHPVHLAQADFVLTPESETWKSNSGAVYPIQWLVAVPSLGIEGQVRTPLKTQEMSGRSEIAPRYWEGVIDFTGKQRGQARSGHGYLEMTGYDHPIDFNP